MATNQPGSQPRQSHAQLVNTIRKTVNWNDTGISGAQGILFGILPQGAFVLQCSIEIVTTYDGASVLTLGSNATADNMVQAGDVDEAAAAVTDVTRPKGRSFTAAADTPVYVKTTGAPTKGQAVIVLTYEANLN